MGALCFEGPHMSDVPAPCFPVVPARFFSYAAMSESAFPSPYKFVSSPSAPGPPYQQFRTFPADRTQTSPNQSFQRLMAVPAPRCGAASVQRDPRHSAPEVPITPGRARHPRRPSIRPDSTSNVVFPKSFSTDLSQSPPLRSALSPLPFAIAGSTLGCQLLAAFVRGRLASCRPGCRCRVPRLRLPWLSLAPATCSTTGGARLRPGSRRRSSSHGAGLGAASCGLGVPTLPFARGGLKRLRSAIASHSVHSSRGWWVGWSPFASFGGHTYAREAGPVWNTSPLICMGRPTPFPIIQSCTGPQICI